MENVRRLRTQAGHRDWHGWLPLQPCRSTGFHLAVVIFIVAIGALVAAQTGITRVHDHAGIGSEADDPHWSGLVGSMMKMHHEVLEESGAKDALAALPRASGQVRAVGGRRGAIISMLLWPSRPASMMTRAANNWEESFEAR